MQTKTNLKIDWATHESAKFACENWHYSKCLPAGALVKIGVWEHEKFVGVVLFSRGATPNLCKPYNLTQMECCELTRIALRNHETPVSKILSIAIKFFKKRTPGMRLIISFADPSQNHHGGIYQATNWIYTGKSNDAKFGVLNGKEIHPRTISEMSLNQKKLLNWVLKPGKHRYLMPLDDKMHRQVNHLKQPYPKRVTSIGTDVSGVHPEEGGVSPTVTLQFINEAQHGATS
jgi:hypothetical protein